MQHTRYKHVSESGTLLGIVVILLESPISKPHSIAFRTVLRYLRAHALSGDMHFHLKHDECHVQAIRESLCRLTLMEGYNTYTPLETALSVRPCPYHPLPAR